MFRYATCVLLLLFTFSVSAETVLITGSNRGMGLEFVKQYADLGWDVIATSRTPGDDIELQELAKANSGIQIESLDVTNVDQLSSLEKEYRNYPIDLVINNAGLSGDRSRQAWGQIEKDEFELLMATNVFGALKVSEAFSDNLIAGGGKKIVAISSIAGSIESMTRPSSLPLLSISKAALNMAMRTVAFRLREKEITVTLLNPGAVDTRALRQAFGLSLEEAGRATNFDYGGYETVSAKDAVSRLIKVINNLDISQTGSFINYDGSEIPW